MKAFVFVFLISLIACKINIIEVGICLVSKPKVKELGLKVLSKVLTKEYSEILPTVLNSIPDIYTALTECLSNPTDDEPILQQRDKAPEGCRNAREYGVCRNLDFSPTLCRYRHC